MTKRFLSPPYPQDLAERLEAYVANGSPWASHPELIEHVLYVEDVRLDEPGCSIAYTTLDNPELRSVDATAEEADDAARAMAIAKLLAHVRIAEA